LDLASRESGCFVIDLQESRGSRCPRSAEEQGCFAVSNEREIASLIDSSAGGDPKLGRQVESA